MTDREIYGAFEAMGPRPGAEAKIWQQIDQSLDGRAEERRIELRPRRRGWVRPVLTAVALAAVLALAILAMLLSARRARQQPEQIPLVSPEVPVEERQEIPAPAPARELILVNARVEGEERLLLTAEMEGAYLARAVLPEGMMVDHWEIDGVTVDPGERRYSLAFSSEGVDRVEAVLRPERTVRCGEHAYLQFLDEGNNSAGPLYRTVDFEHAYLSPGTEQLCPGGKIDAIVLPLIPEGMELDYWLVDGRRMEGDPAPRAVRLLAYDRSVTVDAVLKSGPSRIPLAYSLILRGRAEAEDELPPTAEPLGPADDLPAGLDAPPQAPAWTELDRSREDVPVDPDAPTADGHVHEWSLEQRATGYCVDLTVSVHRCLICGRERWDASPGYHNVIWHLDGDGHSGVCEVCGQHLGVVRHDLQYAIDDRSHQLVCYTCGYHETRVYHTYVQTDESHWICTVCGHVYTGRNPPGA